MIRLLTHLRSGESLDDTESGVYVFNRSNRSLRITAEDWLPHPPRRFSLADHPDDELIAEVARRIAERGCEVTDR